MAYEIKTCEGCGKEFENIPGKNGKVHKKKRYCTKQCWLGRYNVDDREHTLKGAHAGGEANKLKRGISYGGNAYVKENQRHQHRVIAERVLGRILADGEVVHHEDKNRKNNVLTNLIVFKSKADHNHHHHGSCLNHGEPCKCDCIRLHELAGGDAQ